MRFSILYQDENVVAIDKPRGFHVHAPERKPELVPKHKIILQQLRRQIGKMLYPVHRLDVATSGVLLFALNSEAASFLGKMFQEKKIEKTYWAVVRGFTPDQDAIDLPLLSDSSDEMVPCLTEYHCLHRVELPVKVGKKFPSARYSWLEVKPRTGRFHQIRRHMNRIAHPVVGDCDHGDSYHNRFFRNDLKIPGLCLRARSIQGEWPWLSKPIEIVAPLNNQWLRIESLFQNGLPKND